VSYDYPRAYTLPSRTLGLTVIFVALLLSTAGCAIVNTVMEKTGLRSEAKGPASQAQLQGEVMRFADDYVVIIKRLAAVMRTRARTPQDRADAQSWVLGQATACYVIASDPNPKMALLDMIVLVTLERMALEDYWAPKYLGESAQEINQVYAPMEESIWILAGTALTKDQTAALRKAIDEWHAAHPKQYVVDSVRFRDFAEEWKVTQPKAGQSSSSIFSLLYLDPFAGLDPTAREIEFTRRSAERAMYQLQRMPMIISLQFEQLFYQVLATPETGTLLANATRISEATDRLSKTLEKLPTDVAAERRKLIEQLDSSEPGLKALAEEVRQTMEEANKMAASANEAIKSLDQFMGRFDKQPGGPSPEASESRPFDVREYGASAAQIGDAAQKLDALIKSFDQRTSQVNALLDRSAEESKKVVDHAFRMALALALITLACIVAAMLAYRLVASRIPGKKAG